MSELDNYIDQYIRDRTSATLPIRFNHDTDYCQGSSKSAILDIKDGWYVFKCFRCGKRYAKSVTSKLSVRTHKKRSKALPSDSCTTIPPTPRLWLYRFLTAPEVASSGILWSESTQRLWFPIRREGIQHGWTGRNFGDPKRPKYSTIVLTEPSQLFAVHTDHEAHRTIFVEDYISYYKLLSNVSNSNIICLYGTEYKYNITSYIVSNSIIYIFLDNDNSIVKSKQYKLYNILSLFSNHVYVIHSTKDPKEYTVSELHETFSSI